jgi:hypothetical protein
MMQSKYLPLPLMQANNNLTCSLRPVAGAFPSSIALDDFLMPWNSTADPCVFVQPPKTGPEIGTESILLPVLFSVEASACRK